MDLTAFITNMGEKGGMQLIELKITEKVDAVPGERIRADGKCFYKPVRELVPGKSYRLCRNPQNPWDFSCIEIKDRTRVRATLSRDVVQLLSPYLDINAVEEPTWWASFFLYSWLLIFRCFSTKWTIRIVTFLFFLFLSLVLEDAQWSPGDSGRQARSHKVTIPIRPSSTKLHLIREAFKLYDLTVVQE